MKMRLRRYSPARRLLLAALFPLAQLSHAQHQHDSHDIEEIVVSGSQNKTLAETALPVDLLTGEQLRRNASATIGDSINNQLGVRTSSFGAGVAQPVIRGLSGKRVRVLQNNVASLDAAGVSQDHASGVEALVAERIEIIRGPATLLYGNGAIGGIVNVIDRRVPSDLPEEFSGALEARAESVNDGKTFVAKADGSEGAFAWHFDAMAREAKDTDIPGYAIDHEAVEQLLHHDEEEEEEEEEHELFNSRGYIANSDTEATSFSLGGSWVGERGFIGVSFSELNNDYGLPPGAHGHHHEEEEGEEEEEEHHQEFVRLDMEQQRVDVKGEWTLDGWFEKASGQVAFTDYRHEEYVDGEAHGVHGTVFDNEGVDSRFTFNHGEFAGFTGVIGLQYGDRKFSAIGDEAFIPHADIRDAGLFVVETLELDSWIFETGLRFDNQDIALRGGCDNEQSSWSASASSIWKANEDTRFIVGLNRSERAPTVEELYSNVGDGCQVEAEPANWITHAATARIELGAPDLDTETSNNIELGLRSRLGMFDLEANAFFNDFKDYIYLADIDEVDETIVSQYFQEDARFHGFEGKLRFPLAFNENQHIDVTVFGDYVRARLDDGGNVARIPPLRGGLELAYNAELWSMSLRGTRVAAQEHIAEQELASEAYTRFDAYVDVHFPLGASELLLFLKGNNLSDELIREHSSLLKYYAPAPGRSFEIGMRLAF